MKLLVETTLINVVLHQQAGTSALFTRWRKTPSSWICWLNESANREAHLTTILLQVESNE
ncbi:hypothetical protein CCL24_06655 [Pseudomonas congelans]|uniref:Uncharacterized protein n=1 Tax=Pseudomonas syringae pv. actinidiae TaxID=103796 RepID=A0A218MB31_PSESF|nr:hypothetical protein [Pseudomonas syringae pv. actinidiae]PBP73861.1 hypothetical protein CCL21_02845 [Pseudomonas syringae]PBP99071.1 hypothetical protein CCL24_06655 [Pseudomonas congelans]